MTAAPTAQPAIPSYQLAQPEPVFGCTYGPSGIGKSCDLLYSLPCALFIAAPGALKPARTVCGFVPKQTKDKDGKPIEANTLYDVIATIPKAAEKFSELVIDDFSFLVERHLNMLETVKRLKNWDLWSKLTDDVIAFRDAARRARMHVFVNAHDQGPETKPSGKWVRGGPKLPGQLPNLFPPATDLCLRACVTAEDRFGWRGAYRNSIFETDWATKDRHGVVPDMAPMNIGEILRAANYKIKRLPELEWQDEVVEKIAQLLAQCSGDRALEQQVTQAAANRIREKYTRDQLHIRWTLRDAVDRLHLRRASLSILGAYGVV